MCVYVCESVPPHAAWGRVEKLMEILSGVRKIEKWEMRLCAHKALYTSAALVGGRGGERKKRSVN